MNVTERATCELKPYDGNPRVNDGAVDRVAKSIEDFGFRQPIVVDADGVIIVGHTRWKAATKLGLPTVPVHVADLDEAAARAYRIADNKLNELATWDLSLLPGELNALAEMGTDLESLGFTGDELTRLIDGEPVIAEDEAPEPPSDPVTQPGDVWTLGRHRLVCGDCTDAAVVARLGCDGAGVCFTSPPYAQQRAYTEDSKESLADWDGLMFGAFAAAPMADDGQMLVNLGLIHRDGAVWRYWDNWIAASEDSGLKLVGWNVWSKGTAGRDDGPRLSVDHEFVFHLCRCHKEPVKWVPTSDVANWEEKHGRFSEDQILQRKRRKSTKAVNALKKASSVCSVNRSAVRRIGHPAIFPIALADYYVQSWAGDVYEPFAGSGTTLIAAEQLGRTCYAVEIAPAYCDVIVERWQNLTGEKAVRDGA